LGEVTAAGDRTCGEAGSAGGEGTGELPPKVLRGEGEKD